MGLVTVRVYAIDETSAALAGVLVQVFDQTGAFVTQNTTAIVGSDAYAVFTLNGDNPAVDYSVRLSKVGVAFDGLLGDQSKSPQAISVYDPASAAPVTGTNYFTVQGQTFSRPTATNPRLCRASGFFKDASGRARANMDLKFIPLFDPLIVDDDLVVGYDVIGRTDENGYFQVDLYRTGEYQAVLEAFDDVPRSVVVPDASSVNLVHLLFPQVGDIIYSIDPVTVSVDSIVEVELTITTTAGVELDPIAWDVYFTSNDNDVATIQMTPTGSLIIMGVATGSTTISPTATDTTIVSIDPISLPLLTVTVT